MLLQVIILGQNVLGQNRSQSQPIIRCLQGGLIALAAGLVASPAQAFSLWTDNRAGFDASLNSNSTIVDSDGLFAADPSVGTGLASIERAGNIGGDAYGYQVFDVNFGAGSTEQLADDILSLSNLNIERSVSQDGATGIGSWGIDSSGGNNASRNAALFDFTQTPDGTGIGHFGIDLHDFETSVAGTLAQIRLYRSGELISAQDFDWGSPDNGNGESHFLGVTATDESEFFDQVMIVLGDDDVGDFGNRERWAADRMTFGAAYAEAPMTEVPEPSAIAAILGLSLGLLRRRQNQI